MTQLAEEVDKTEAGPANALGVFVQHLHLFRDGLVMSFPFNWNQIHVSVTCLPIVYIAFAAVGIVIRKIGVQASVAYSQASVLAERCC